MTLHSALGEMSFFDKSLYSIGSNLSMTYHASAPKCNNVAETKQRFSLQAWGAHAENQPAVDSTQQGRQDPTARAIGEVRGEMSKEDVARQGMVPLRGMVNRGMWSVAAACY
eukprot:m.89650 g.89650  ORF g.89650 m.89650 type:complete len:112 (-) comp16451_c0_seq2:1064-1399(-)